MEAISAMQIPCYLFLPERFSDNYNYFVSSMTKYLPNLMVAYALKANYLGSLLKLAKKLGSGVEVMSLFEFLLAKRAGFKTNEIVVNGPAKSKSELEHTIKEGITYVNVDSFNELKTIEEMAQKYSITQPVTIRIHPQLSEQTEKRLLIKKNSKLGIDYARARKLYKYIKKSPYLQVKGIHLHVGTNLSSHDFYSELLVFINDYITDLEAKLGFFIETINLGGGLASRAQLKEKGFKLEFLAKQIKETIDGIKERKIIFEPGRYLVGDSFIAIANVLRIKKSWGRRWAFIDVGANTLIPLRYSNFFLIPVVNKGSDQPTHIGGPLCLPVDVISEKAINFNIEENDRVVILNCGAYTLSMSEQFGYPRPPIFELNNGKIALLKEGDRISEMIKFWME